MQPCPGVSRTWSRIIEPFIKLGLARELVRAVSDNGYTEPTAVQAEAIPLILDGRDVMAGAQTGTGKTAGFTLPMLQNLANTQQNGGQGRRNVRCLILTPTRELAAQVAESVRTYGKYMPLRSTVIYGGVGMNPQIGALRRGVDVVIATPGRLLDHARQRNIDLRNVEILILDEADRMLDMGFMPDIEKIISLMPEKRQNLLFSATFPNEIKKLAEQMLDNPAEVQVTPRNTVTELVSQVVHPVDRGRKRELLSFMIGSQNWRQVLVFCRTKHGANKLAEQLDKDGIRTTAIHGNKSQAARTKALTDFKRGQVRVLVATDIAARGLDIDQLPHVVNYELPNVPEDYVHRIGRTGRAGNEGQAVSLVCSDERGMLIGIERLLKTEIAKEVIEGYEPTGGGRFRENSYGGRPRNGGGGYRGGGGGNGGGPRNSGNNYGRPARNSNGNGHGNGNGNGHGGPGSRAGAPSGSDRFARAGASDRPNRGR